MPKIKPFKALLPGSDDVEEIVVHLENLTVASAKEIGSKKPNSFVHLLVPKIENYYLRGSKQEIAFQLIEENLQEFIQNRILQQQPEEAIYVYEQTKDGKTYTGLWTVSCIDDYLNNHIKKHELTRAEREKGLILYLNETGIDTNPVLITYPAQSELEEIIQQTKTSEAVLDFKTPGEHHRLWKITHTNHINIIVKTFSTLNETYIADGHHRAAAASTFGMERRKLNLKHNGSEAYNFFSSIYISSQQLSILPFHRLIKLNGQFEPSNFLLQLKERVVVKTATIDTILPQSAHQIGLYVDHKSYMIDVQNLLSGAVLQDLDVSILQSHLLEPIFGINNPRDDQQMAFIGGKVNISEVIADIDSGKYNLGFFLYPILVEDLMQIADLGETMPPKSTWFEPKFLAGLVTHLITP